MNRVKGKASEEITIELTEHMNQMQPKVERAAANHNRRTGEEVNDRGGSATSIGKEVTIRQRGRTVKPQPSQQKINSLHNIKE